MPTASQTGPLASGVPGRSRLTRLRLRSAARSSWREHSRRVKKRLAKDLKSAAGMLARFMASGKHSDKFEGSRAIFFKADGKPIAAGDRLVQTDLANTYQQIAAQGTDYFYRGDVAKKIGDWMAANGGIMTAEDFAKYEAKIREPLRSTYRGYEIVGFPPPSSGGVHVAQVLNILENFDLQSIGHDDPVEAAHIVSEASSWRLPIGRIGWATRIL